MPATGQGEPGSNSQKDTMPLLYNNLYTSNLLDRKNESSQPFYAKNFVIHSLILSHHPYGLCETEIFSLPNLQAPAIRGAVPQQLLHLQWPCGTTWHLVLDQQAGSERRSAQKLTPTKQRHIQHSPT